MSRLPGLGVAQSVVALVFLAALVLVGAASLGVLGNGPAGASPSPTAIAVAPTPTDTPVPATAPAETTPSPAPEATSTPVPSGEVVAYTNPDGISPDGFAGDDYPFIEMAHSLPTYAGLWGDENGRDFHVAVTGDIPGAIEDLKAGIPRGITVYFHIAQYTEAEICAIRDAMFNDRDELMHHGIVLMGGGCGNREMRVHIQMSPISPEAVAYMQARYPGPVDYEGGGWVALKPFEPVVAEEVRLIALRAGDESGLSTCGRRPFPDSALAAAASDINAAGPEFVALRDALDIYVDVYGDLSSLTWVLAEKDTYGATFLADRGDTWLEVPVVAGIDGWVPGTIDYCVPRPLGAGDAGNAAWRLDPDFPAPQPGATEVHVLVAEQACSGGSSPASRLLPPVVSYASSAITLTVAVRHSGGAATCPGNPALPVTIVLPEPIGDRELKGDAPPRY